MILFQKRTGQLHVNESEGSLYNILREKMVMQWNQQRGRWEADHHKYGSYL
jgi:hypothetical protein